MYRSQLLYEQVKDSDSKIYPICVPSYNRPDPVILKSLETYPDLPIILFIRNTKEQKHMYKKWKNKCRIVCLNNVHDIGETRKAIIDWCIKNKISNIFMMDDDIDELDFLYPHETKNGTVCMRAARQNMNRPYKGINPFTLRMWISMINSRSKDLTLSSPLYRPDSWHLKNKDSKETYNDGACIQCLHINVKNLYKAHVNYSSNLECGTEDYALQFRIMTAGLLTCTFRDLMYGCPAINSRPGGCENANGYSDPVERYKMYIEKFLQNVCGKDHPGILIKTTRSGMPSIKFNWKYWKKEKEEI